MGQCEGRTPVSELVRRFEWPAVLLVSVAILVFLWTLHTDISDLAQRVSRIEGLPSAAAGGSHHG